MKRRMTRTIHSLLEARYPVPEDPLLPLTFSRLKKIAAAAQETDVPRNINLTRPFF